MINKSDLPTSNKEILMIFLYVAVVALLPFGRLSEIPILILAIWGMVHVIKHYHDFTATIWFKSFTWVYLAFFTLSVISSIDSYWPEKSWLVSMASWRFYFMGVLLISHHRPKPVVKGILNWVTLLVLFWVIDALVQALLGFNLLGFEHYPGRLTGIFGQNVKLGPVLALFLPLVLIQMCQKSSYQRWLAVTLVLVVILLSGTRSAWLMAAFVMLMFWWHHVKGRRLILLLKVSTLSVLGITLLWNISDDFKQRVARSAQVFNGDVASVDFALADRLPIWKTAINMYQDNPINGVGARAFRKAYNEYAEVDDVWIAQHGTGLHAHHWVLELMAETGTIGLMLMAFLLLQVVRFSWSTFQKNTVWPMAVALMTALLPVVSLYSLFSSFWSICLWWMLILLFLGVKHEQS